jgi:hypothetical protein
MLTGEIVFGQDDLGRVARARATFVSGLHLQGGIMKNSARMLYISVTVVVAVLLIGGHTGRMIAKEKSSQVSPDDATLRLYSLLDSKYNGKLDEFYLLADVVNDPKNPDQPQQHVLRVDYGKDRAFGKLNIHVRTVGQVTPEQLKAYSPKQIYDFAESDSEKFTKTDPGTFGRPGDVHFAQTSDGGALGAGNVIPEVQSEYDRFVNQYIIPALEKKPGEASGS